MTSQRTSSATSVLHPRRPIIHEEPYQPVTIHLLNEIRKYCEGCGAVKDCATAKSAGALRTCTKIKEAEANLRQKAGCPV